MAQFRGTLKGNRGDASRLGTKVSGLRVTANGWNIGCEVNLVHNADMGDGVHIWLTSGSNQRGQFHLLATIDEKTDKIELGEQAISRLSRSTVLNIIHAWEGIE